MRPGPPQPAIRRCHPGDDAEWRGVRRREHVRGGCEAGAREGGEASALLLRPRAGADLRIDHPEGDEPRPRGAQSAEHARGHVLLTAGKQAVAAGPGVEATVVAGCVDLLREERAEGAHLAGRVSVSGGGGGLAEGPHEMAAQDLSIAARGLAPPDLPEFTFE